MKIAISGKGGVGKTTVAAALALLMSQHGKKVLAVDADPDANLASALGIPAEQRQQIVPISRQKALIEERTGAKVDQYGQIFKLNPEVADIASTHAINHKGVALLVLGAINKGGGGCACPENTLIRALVADLVLYKDDALVMDMEAGIEHLGRGTAHGVDIMLVVVEPGQKSVDSARRIVQLASDIGLKKIKLIANKIGSRDDEQFLSASFPDSLLLEKIPYSETIRRSDREGLSVLDGLPADTIQIFSDIFQNLEKEANEHI
jgi:CO dehydrogenase maturation factor